VYIKGKIPIVVYDNQCYLCTKFAKTIDFLARGKFSMVGHYSNFGEELRKNVLDESALEMFWFIDKNIAYGGRAALIPLLKSIITTKNKKSFNTKINEKCEQECKTVKAVFFRSASLLTNSKKINF